MTKPLTPNLRGTTRVMLGALACSAAALLVMVGVGCGDSDECAGLERLCTEQCASPDTRRECAEIYEQRDQDLCDAWYKAFAQRCPSGIDFSSED